MMATSETNTFSAAQQPALNVNVRQNCRICTEELTDGASINHGIGPVCRKKANKALALDIRTDIGKVDFLPF